MSDQMNLFEMPTCEIVKTEQHVHSDLQRKLSSPSRQQIEFTIQSLDDQIPLNHDVRTIWNFVEQLDLSLARDKIISLEGNIGRSAIDPKILISLWIYGISQGIVSARKIAQFCSEHKGFAWICGGVSVGHHILSRFRSENTELFHNLVVQSIAILLDKDLITLKNVSQDGVKIRACASKSSMRRKQTLKEKTSEIIKHINELERQKKQGVWEKEERKKKERELAEAKKKKESIKKALLEMNELKELKNKNRIKYRKKKLSNNEISELRTSITDAESRKMKLADGSYQPAYNFQLSTEVETDLVLYTRITQNGTDGGELLPMYNDLTDTYQRAIDNFLVDAGFKNEDDLQALYEKNCNVYMPVTRKSNSLKQRVLSKNTQGISEAIIAWIHRMNTKEADAIYKKRIRSSETINAFFRNHGLGQLLVKGMRKAKGMIDLFCLTYNMLTIKRLYNVI